MSSSSSSSCPLETSMDEDDIRQGLVFELLRSPMFAGRPLSETITLLQLIVAILVVDNMDPGVLLLLDNESSTNEGSPPAKKQALNCNIHQSMPGTTTLTREHTMSPMVDKWKLS